jgi:hypothetical protein
MFGRNKKKLESEISSIESKLRRLDQQRQASDEKFQQIIKLYGSLYKASTSGDPRVSKQMDEDAARFAYQNQLEKRLQLTKARHAEAERAEAKKLAKAKARSEKKEKSRPSTAKERSKNVTDEYARMAEEKERSQSSSLEQQKQHGRQLQYERD